MVDSSDSEPTASRVDGPARPAPSSDTASVEAIPDPDFGTVTFAQRRPEAAETTTAWITAEASIVVSGSDMQ